MHNSNIKEANRKALPKFLLILLISLVIGGTIGYCSAKFGFNELTGSFKRVASGFSTYVAPWMMLETAILVPTVCLPIYRSAKKLLQTWDGEDEALSETVDNKISIVVWITSCAMICSFFLMAATYSNGFATFEQHHSVYGGHCSVFCHFNRIYSAAAKVCGYCQSNQSGKDRVHIRYEISQKVDGQL